MNDIEIIRCTAPDELYCRYDGQSEAQGAYIELDLQRSTLLADYDAQVDGGVPAAVYHGFERRYAVPVLTGEAANRVMEEIKPLAARVLADWEEVWDGNNMVARLGEDAQAAEDEIGEHLGLDYSGMGFETVFSDEDLVAQWDTDGAVNGHEAEEYNITAQTSDARLDEIAAEITRSLAECGESTVAVVHGLDEYLRGLRDELAAASD
ncbi:hypothetical protein [Streptomyces sp. B27]|uniref:hypothetical protein n=1 Tax=Streptomyces sp. B27 TaxID=2485015 RepID=UPI000FDBA9FD|nr:hypothetical protein [Streptomyces sp. B27]